MVIRQGDIFWVNLGEPYGSEPGYLHPYLVIQNNVFNESRLNTIVMCALTSNTRLAKYPGNVMLEKGEANLPKRSVVNITQIFTVDKKDLLEKIGAISPARIAQVLKGVELLITPADIPE